MEKKTCNITNNKLRNVFIRPTCEKQMKKKNVRGGEIASLYI